MGLKDLLLEKKAKVEAFAAEEIAKIEAKKIAEIGEIDSMMSSYDVDMKASEDKGFDLGIAQAGVPAGDKIYTEEDLQKEKELVAAPFLEKVAALEVTVAELQAEKEKLPELIQAAVDLKVVEIVADFEAAQVDDAAFLAKYKKV